MNIVDLQSEPAAFRAALKIDTDSGPQPFSRAWTRGNNGTLLPWTMVGRQPSDSSQHSSSIASGHG